LKVVSLTDFYTAFGFYITEKLLKYLKLNDLKWRLVWTNFFLWINRETFISNSHIIQTS